MGTHRCLTCRPASTASQAFLRSGPGFGSIARDGSRSRSIRVRCVRCASVVRGTLSENMARNEMSLLREIIGLRLFPTACGQRVGTTASSPRQTERNVANRSPRSNDVAHDVLRCVVDSNPAG